MWRYTVQPVRPQTTVQHSTCPLNAKETKATNTHSKHAKLFELQHHLPKRVIMSPNIDIIFLVSLVNHLDNYKREIRILKENICVQICITKDPLLLSSINHVCSLFPSVWHKIKPHFKDFYGRVRINVIYELFTQIIDTIEACSIIQKLQSVHNKLLS